MHWSVIDRTLMELLVLLSSSDAARLAATAWLAAFDAARGAGASEDQAQARASDAWARHVRAQRGARGVGDGSGMLAASAGVWNDARPPPAVAG